MKSIHNYRDLCLKHLSILYRTEEQYVTYLRVLGHKARSEPLKNLLPELMNAAFVKQEWMNAIFASLNTSPALVPTEGINGIFKEGFRLLNDEDHASLADASILHTLVLSSYYKLGNYRSLFLYFESLEFSAQAGQLAKILSAEENALSQMQEQITESYLLNVFAPAQKQPISL
jgi:ferritin-like metal-binding protein YciE